MRSARICLVGIMLISVVWGAAPLAHAGSTPPNIAMTPDRGVAYLEPSLAVNPRNPRNLLGAAYFTPDPHSFNKGRIPATFVSTDGGATWRDNGPLALPPGYTSGSNVSVTFTTQGIGLVVVRVDNGPDHTGIVVWRTVDGGRHFLAPVALAARTGPTVNVDHPWLAAAPAGGSGVDPVYVAWSVTTSRRSDIAFCRSDDGGLHFTVPRLVSGPAQQTDVAPVMAAGPAGRVFIAYPDLNTSGAGADSAANLQLVDIKGVSSADGGRHFALPREVTPATLGSVSARPLPEFGFPAVASDPRDDTLFVAITRVLPGSVHPVMVLLRSRDGGHTWTALAHVVSGPGGSRVDYLQPEVAVTADGTLAVSYLEMIGGRLDLYLVRSHDRGDSFQAPVRVTSRSWDPRWAIDDGNGQFWIGDYQALAVGPRAIYPVWSDTRSGCLAIYIAALPE